MTDMNLRVFGPSVWLSLSWAFNWMMIPESRAQSPEPRAQSLLLVQRYCRHIELAVSQKSWKCPQQQWTSYQAPYPIQLKLVAGGIKTFKIIASQVSPSSLVNADAESAIIAHRAAIVETALRTWRATTWMWAAQILPGRNALASWRSASTSREDIFVLLGNSCWLADARAFLQARAVHKEDSVERLDFRPNFP